MTDKELQSDLDDAQADLEKRVGQLKHVLQAKVERVEKPFQWAFEHIPEILVGTGLAIVAISLIRARAHREVLPRDLPISGPIARGIAALDRMAIAMRDALAERDAVKP